MQTAANASMNSCLRASDSFCFSSAVPHSIPDITAKLNIILLFPKNHTRLQSMSTQDGGISPF